jgi:membrane protease YdiL (CAAX protease family)
MNPTTVRGRVPLWQIALDVLLVIIATVGLATALTAGLVAVRLSGAGLPEAATPEALVRLLGADGLLAVITVQNLCFAAVPLVRIVWLRREPWSALGLHAGQPGRNIVIGGVLGIALLLLNGLIGALFQAAGVTQNQAQLYPLLPGDRLGHLLFFIGAALLAPLGEELLFRGYLFSTIRPYSRALAYVLSALAFALAHGLSATEGVVVLLTTTFAIGIALAAMREQTGSLVPAIVAHMVNNAVAVSALIVCIDSPAPAWCPAG